MATGLIIVAIVVLLIIIAQNVIIVRESNAVVLEQLGAYCNTLNTGFHIKVPLIQRIAKRVSLKEQVLDYAPQPVITKDNVTIQIDTVVYFHITNPRLYCYGVENPMIAMETLTATTLRNVIGELELDETLTSRDKINSKMSEALDRATDPWGIKINRVELKNIMPPRDIQEAMEKQMRAEREKREVILKAEGDKQASILLAEGEKESAALRAEAAKIAVIREAEGHYESIRLHKQAEADGIMKVQQAEAQAISMLKQAGLNAQQILQLKSYDAFKKAADGQATKIIIPSEIQSLASLAVGVKEATKD